MQKTTGLDSVGERVLKYNRQNHGGGIRSNQLIGVSKKLYERSRIINLDRIDVSQFIYFIVNNFYCVIDCLNMNCVTVCRAKCHSIVNFYLQIIPLITHFLLLEEKKTKFLIPKTI